MTATHSDIDALTGWRALVPHFRPWRRSLAGIGFLSVITALLDAAVLVTIAPLLVSVGSRNESVSGTLAGIEVTLDAGELTLIAFALVLLRAVTTLTTRKLEARLLAR